MANQIIKVHKLAAPDTRRPMRVEPLDPETWAREIEKLRRDFLRLGKEEMITPLLRRGFFLTSLAPDPLWEFVAPYVSECELENAIEAGGAEAALDLLITPDLIRDVTVDGQIDVTISAPSIGMSGSWSADNKVDAMMGAWLGCLDPFSEQSDTSANSSNVVSLGQHKFQSALRRRLTEL